MTDKAIVYLIGVIVISNAIVFTNGGPSKCYYCNTDADGTGCDTPIDTSVIRIQLCSDLSLVSGTNTSVQAENATNSVCQRLTYYQSGSLVTIRGCEKKEIYNTELCSYLATTVAGSVSNFNCETCETDLCNSSSATHISFACFSVLVTGVLTAFVKTSS
ncbi:hypothetical protein NQ318_020626 [Aromia moschata]|uniref:Protein sleepless n=1 Tax=Aromia moschata TaxID=1265417 RepID=A0AAV8Z012_9CUCU|nr:hypothetical protein NQ318_020626 [Aromia moschata]